jgi:hypothetical protein
MHRSGVGDQGAVVLVEAVSKDAWVSFWIFGQIPGIARINEPLKLRPRAAAARK